MSKGERYWDSAALKEGEGEREKEGEADMREKMPRRRRTTGPSRNCCNEKGRNPAAASVCVCCVCCVPYQILAQLSLHTTSSKESLEYFVGGLEHFLSGLVLLDVCDSSRQCACSRI